jgi:xanthine dehydrogenase small subunit
VTREAVTDALAGNLCRCTGYRPIVDAALLACAEPPDDRFARSRAGTAAAVAGLADGADLFFGEGTRLFAAPASEDALAALYAEHPDATLVAGCTDVGLWITKGLAEIDKVIWLGRVAGLDRLEDGPDALRIGAAVTHADAHGALAGIDPDLGELLRRFGLRAPSAAISPTGRRSAISRRPSSRSGASSISAGATASGRCLWRTSSLPIAVRTARPASSSAA